MWANTCWGLLGIAITLGIAMIGLPLEYVWLQPWFLRGAILSLAASILCFSWPLVRRLFASTSSARLVGAIAAFNRIVSKSRWAKRLRKHPEVMKRGPYETSHTEDENIQRRLELHLDNEIHDKLRAGELTAWGRTNHGNPLRRIQSDEWDEIAIMFDKELLTKGSTNACAWLRDDRLVPGGRIRYIRVQFLQTEIRKLFR